MNFDITKLASVQTADLHVCDQSEELLYALDENGKPDLNRPLTITLYGPGSKIWRHAEHKVSQANQMTTFAAIRGKQTKETAEEAHERIANRWAECTVSLNNFDHPNGVVGLYKQIDLGFILDQVVRFATDWKNFPAASTKS